MSFNSLLKTANIESRFLDRFLGFSDYIKKFQKCSYRDDPEVGEFRVTIQDQEVFIACYQVIGLSTQGGSEHLIIL